MIKSIKVINYLNESIEFELTNPEKSGFYIKEITGLGPPNSIINSTEMATADGAIYNSARLTSRNVVLTLGFLMKPTIEAVRYLSYKYFPAKKHVTLVVTTDERVGEVYGYVESNEPNIFSELQTTQISIICPDPFFYSVRPQTTLFAGVDPNFEFPFSNESLTEPLIEMGLIMVDNTRTVLYKGDADVGVIIDIYFHGPVKDFVIFDPDTGRKMEISDARLLALTGAVLSEGDRIVISSVRGDKYIKFIRKDVETNILNVLNRDAYWFQLNKGDNLFSYTATYGLTNIFFTIINKIVYEGV